MRNTTPFQKSSLVWFLIFLGIAILAAALAPLEKTLGSNARFVYFHGAWVWTAILSFGAAAFLGLLAVLSRRMDLHHWSLALGRTGLFFWITFLPMSLIVMQANWNGLFLDEPRFRIPLNFAIVGLLLQIGLALFSKPLWSSLANLAYGIAFFWGMTQAETILHPDSPIFRSDARDIQVYFLLLTMILSISALCLAYRWLNWETRKNRAT